MRPVYSSYVDSIGYDEGTATLVVKFKSGKTGAYAGVPPDVASQVLQAPSIGGALHNLVRPNYVFQYVEGVANG